MDIFAVNEIIQRIKKLSRDKWGKENVIELVGQNEEFLKQIRNLDAYSKYKYPVLITGETGVGKEWFAKSLYLIGPRNGQSFITVNCPQFQDPNLTVSALFGHKKGSYTGADTDHKGFFELADKGTIFLDEIGDIHSSVQSLLLRVVSEGEYWPLGSENSKNVNVRVIAATNKNFELSKHTNDFRSDLFYRIKFFRINIPPLRKRGDDWHLLLLYFLDQLVKEYNEPKQFSKGALECLSNYHWPGNIRELKGLVITAFSLSEHIIQVRHFENELDESNDNNKKPDKVDKKQLADIYDNGKGFWDSVQKPFLKRELNRCQVKDILNQGLILSGGSYKKLLPLIGVRESQYLKFMDFLRTHNLKPD